jgi:hypothetical protein
MYSMPLTVEDVLMLARAVENEGAPSEGVAWTLLQRAAWYHSHGMQVTLHKLIEQYVQPINPMWFPDGALHLAEVARLTRLNQLAKARDEISRAQARPAKAKERWQDMTAHTRSVIAGILTGYKKSPVIGALNYWETMGPTFAANQKAKPNMILLDPGFGWEKVNVFFTEDGAQSFGGLKIQNGLKSNPEGGGMLLAGSGPGTIIGAGVLAFLAWKWWLS